MAIQTHGHPHMLGRKWLRDNCRLPSSPRKRRSSTPQLFHGAKACNRRNPIFSQKVTVYLVPAFAGMTIVGGDEVGRRRLRAEQRLGFSSSGGARLRCNSQLVERRVSAAKSEAA